MALKKYKHRIYRRLVTSVRDNEGVKYPIVFAGGIGGQYKNGGHFITSDENCQNAIENDPRFGVEFDLCFAYQTPEQRNGMKEIVEDVKENEINAIEEPFTLVEVDESLEVIDSPMDKQSARIFFRDKGETSIAPNLTKNAVLKLCDKYKVKFTNLQF